MNPYATQLGTRDPLEVICATADRLHSLAATLGPERLDQPWAPGKWTSRQILCHLADCEVVFAVRLRHTLAEPHHIIQPFDQDQWSEPYSAYDYAKALATFTAVRNWNIALIRSVIPAALARPVTHPERGSMTFQTLIETMGGHDLNHLAQIESAAKA